MKFTKAEHLEDTIWAMKLADMPRAGNRTLIAELFDGFPPYSDRQVKQNNISVNFNDLSPTKLAQDARSQYSTAAFTPAQYFAVRVDRGASHQRDEWSEIITTELRKVMKTHGVKARHYRQTMCNNFASLVLHGIGPSMWPDKESWCPDMMAIGDVMLPSQTLITMENVPYFSVYRRYTAMGLWKMTHGPKVDPAWDVKVAERCVQWAAKQWGTITGVDANYSPERVEQDIKGGGGVYASDAVPTINCWDTFIYDDDDKEAGWKRKIILDVPSINEASDWKDKKIGSDTKNLIESRNDFLYDGKKRKYASRLDEIIHFQFADGSAVAPHRYHTIRSLGQLLYSVCHIQNRLRCSLTEAAFEACLQYFRVANLDDAQKAIKFSLINRGIIPDGVNFVGAQERWKVDQQLIESVMLMNRQSIAENSTAFTKDFGYGEQGQTDKTATQVTAEVNAASALVGAMLEQWYGLQDFQYREICRRFCRPNSKDPDVRKFRVNCLTQGVPAEILDVECWDISAERIMGNGNRQLALGQAQAIMAQYPLLDPDAQRIALRSYMFAVTNDAAKTTLLVPNEQNKISDAAIMAAESVGTLMLGLPVPIKEGLNHVDAIETLLGQLAMLLKQVGETGALPTPQQLMGFGNVANQINQHIEILAQDKGSKEKVKQYSDDLNQLVSAITAFQQQAQQQAEAAAAQNGNGEIPADQKAKIAAEMMKSEAKVKMMELSHAQRMEQRAAIHDEDMRKENEREQLENASTIRRTEVEESVADLKGAAEIARMAAKPTKALTE